MTELELLAKMAGEIESLKWLALAFQIQVLFLGLWYFILKN